MDTVMKKSAKKKREPSVNERPSLIKILLIAVRPWALPASTMPVIFGTAMAVIIGKATFNLVLFLLALFAMVILHSGANMLNDFRDYRKGLDKVPTPGSGAVVRGYIGTKFCLIMALLLLGAGSVLGLILIYYVGLPILILGVVGIVIGILYSMGPVALKYHALGDLAVFLNFGTLGALGAWTVQTKSLSWIPALWVIPMSILVVAILHANNWRDIQEDKQGGFVSVASLLGDKASLTYYRILIFGAFGVVLLLLFLTRAVKPLQPAMPFTFLITLLVFPFAVKLIRQGKRRALEKNRLDFFKLDAMTANLNLLFGLLCTAALILHAVIGG